MIEFEHTFYGSKRKPAFLVQYDSTRNTLPVYHWTATGHWEIRATLAPPRPLTAADGAFLARLVEVVSGKKKED